MTYRRDGQILGPEGCTQTYMLRDGFMERWTSKYRIHLDPVLRIELERHKCFEVKCAVGALDLHQIPLEHFQACRQIPRAEPQAKPFDLFAHGPMWKIALDFGNCRASIPKRRRKILVRSARQVEKGGQGVQQIYKFKDNGDGGPWHS